MAALGGGWCTALNSAELADLAIGIETGWPTAADVEARPLGRRGVRDDEAEALEPDADVVDVAQLPLPRELPAPREEEVPGVVIGAPAGGAAAAGRRARRVEALAGEAGAEETAEERWNADLERFHHVGITEACGDQEARARRVNGIGGGEEEGGGVGVRRRRRRRRRPPPFGAASLFF